MRSRDLDLLVATRYDLTSRASSWACIHSGDGTAGVVRMAGIERILTHPFEVRSDELPPLRLELSVAPAVSQNPNAEQIVVYVLDPEPALFAAATLFVYAQSGYYASTGPEHCESAFPSMSVVGVGHARQDYSSTSAGWDAAALRQLRRRDFPPFGHPSVQPVRGPNPHAARLACALADTIAPHAERELLALKRPVKCRALLGSSYSGTLALLSYVHRPTGFDAYILGSPSVPFDPEILDLLKDASPHPLLKEATPGREAAATGAAPSSPAASSRAPSFFIAVGANEREPGEPDEPGWGVRPCAPGARLTSRVCNVHRHIPDAAHSLARLLRSLGLEVEGVHEVAGEDHTSLKLPLVSRGLLWLARVATPEAEPAPPHNPAAPLPAQPLPTACTVL